MVLKLDGHGYSPSIQLKVVEAGAQLKSFKLASQMLRKLAEVSISGRHVGRLTEKVGAELREARDHRTQRWMHYRSQPRGEGSPQAVAVAVDGGRMMTRQPGHGPGVHGQGWKEDKVACLHTLLGPTFEADPRPEPPPCFLDHRYVADLTRDLKSRNGLAGKDPEEELPTSSTGVAGAANATSEASEPVWPPKRVVRTCVATQRSIDAFGPMVAAEAHARNFEKASRRAFLGDGLACNWTMHAQWFKEYRAIVDFIHPLAYVYLAAAAATTTLTERWTRYIEWMTALWQGRVAEVLAALEELQTRLGPIPEGAAPATDDPRLPIAAAVTYLGNNRSRMNYPEYRREGLPITSCAVESLIKEFNYRVKGTEKFWNTPDGTETILQVRAAVLSDDERLERHMQGRPGNPFRRPRRPSQTAEPAAAA